jgi:hypothetical protein
MPLCSPIVIWIFCSWFVRICSKSSWQPQNGIATTFFLMPLNCQNLLESTDHSIKSILKKRKVVVLPFPSCHDEILILIKWNNFFKSPVAFMFHHWYSSCTNIKQTNTTKHKIIMGSISTSDGLLGWNLILGPKVKRSLCCKVARGRRIWCTWHPSITRRRLKTISFQN